MKKIKLVGYVTVYSGQVMICDPYYIDSSWKHVKEWKTHEEFRERIKNEKEGSFNYLGACQVTLSEEQAGQLCLAVASSSGYGGSGKYPVFATYKDGRIKQLKINFF